MVGGNNTLLYLPTTYSSCVPEGTQVLPETTKVNHALRNFACSSKPENPDMLNYFLAIFIPRISTLEKFYYMVEFVRFY